MSNYWTPQRGAEHIERMRLANLKRLQRIMEKREAGADQWGRIPIKMYVSDWMKDEHGNDWRVIRAVE